MIKLCIDNTALLHEFHLYEPYLYGVIKNKDCFFVNDISNDNSDIENFDITIRSAENILIDHKGADYEVTIITELKENDISLVQKMYEIDKYITSKFVDSPIQKTKNVTIILLDYTGSSHVDFKESLYVSPENNDLFFSRNELRELEEIFNRTKDRKELINNLISLKDSKEINRENEWYFNMFEKIIEQMYDSNIIECSENIKLDLVDIFSRIMSYYVKKELIDNKLILRYDMYSEKNLFSINTKNFNDMNKLIALLTFDMGELLEKSKTILYKGIFNVSVGIDDNKVKDMIMQYSENLKIQKDMLIRNKPNKIEVVKRVMPNVSLRNIYLEPVKIKKERVTFFRSKKNVQYLDRIEKNLANAINKRIKKAKSYNIQNICDLRTLRYTDDKATEKEKLSLIELKDKIDEKMNEYKRKNSELFKERLDYYEILDEYLKNQKKEKEKIINTINHKVKLKEFFLLNILMYFFIGITFLICYPDIENKISDIKSLLITLGYLGITVLISSLTVLIVDNLKIKKQIKTYIDFVNKYNSKLQISSNEELKKLTNTYELIMLNSDIEYYKKQYNNLLNSISKYEFHISQINRHIDIAKRLCARVGLRFNDVIIADDSILDEKNVDVDINKDVYNNSCYSITHFLFETKDYCMMLNSGEVIEKVGLETYIKSINFTEDEVYNF